MELEELKSLNAEMKSPAHGSRAQRAEQKDRQINCKLGKRRLSRRTQGARGWTLLTREKSHMGRMKRPKQVYWASLRGQEGDMKHGRKMPTTDARSTQSPKKNEHIGYLSFPVCFASLSTTISRSIHVAASGITAFFFTAK